MIICALKTCQATIPTGTMLEHWQKAHPKEYLQLSCETVEKDNGEEWCGTHRQWAVYCHLKERP